MKRLKKTGKAKIIWYRKSTFQLIQTVALISLIIFGIFFIPSFFRDRKANELNGRSTGIVVKIEPRSAMTRGYYELRESIYSYELTFVYTVDSITYTNTNNISTQGKYSQLIRSIRASNFTKKIDISYNEKNPQESYIIIE